MLLRNYRHHLVAGLGLALACDERYTVATTVTLPDEVAAAYTPADRGLVVVSIRSDAGRDVRVVDVVCGEGDTYRVSTGGFGARPDAEVQAWIEPLPADDARPCGKFTSPKGAITHYTVDADEPQAQASSEGSDGGCNDSTSGSVTIELTLAAP